MKKFIKKTLFAFVLLNANALLPMTEAELAADIVKTKKRGPDAGGPDKESGPLKFYYTKTYNYVAYGAKDKMGSDGKGNRSNQCSSNPLADYKDLANAGDSIDSLARQIKNKNKTMVQKTIHQLKTDIWSLVAHKFPCIPPKVGNVLWPYWLAEVQRVEDILKTYDWMK